MDLEKYVTGFNSPLDCYCRKMAPSPYDDASAESVVLNYGSNNARTGSGRQHLLDFIKRSLLRFSSRPLVPFDQQVSNWLR